MTGFAFPFSPTERDAAQQRRPRLKRLHGRGLNGSLAPGSAMLVSVGLLACLAGCSASAGNEGGPGFRSGVTPEGKESSAGSDGNPTGDGPNTPLSTAGSGSSTGSPSSGGSGAGSSGSGFSGNGDGQLLLEDCDDASCKSPSATDPPPPGCGDGTLTDDEACDDGNLESGDGCASNCLLTEPGFSCASPGKLCHEIARCGDGLVAESEQCDDANMVSEDGCSDRCKVEFGKKCEGSPSVCSDAECGNGIQEGAEACDDGNTQPFDGCSSLCFQEPNCEGLSCVSDCGDGLVINEECDDGNTRDGDGCSAACTIETGFTCTRDTSCETVNGSCVLRVPAIFRDFSDNHEDFGGHTCEDLVVGVVADELDAEGRPTAVRPGNACIDSAASYAEWYRDGDYALTVVGNIVLFDNGDGGYVNRFGAEGEQFASVVPETERHANQATTLAQCEAVCRTFARDGQPYTQGGMQQPALRCDDICRPLEEQQRQLRDNALNQANNNLQAIEREEANLPEGDADALEEWEADVAAAEAEIETIQADIAALGDEIATCEAECEADIEERAAPCAETCAPCSDTPNQFCTGGVPIAYDGNPLFFPLDDVMGPTASSDPAKIPEQYGKKGWPWEEEVFGGNPEHNFYFTSEVQYWFQYEADTNATLDFLGDDDVWVFLNGKLAVDLGGIHVPSTGTLTINAAMGTITSRVQDGRAIQDDVTGAVVDETTRFTPADFGLADGGVYKISIFHAERQMEGSSFKLTLAGFEATPSDCTAICGDGVLSFGEECDDGANDGGYGECTEGCVLGGFCGDGIVQEGFEDCDNGPAGGDSCPGCRKLKVVIK